LAVLLPSDSLTNAYRIGWRWYRCGNNVCNDYCCCICAGK